MKNHDSIEKKYEFLELRLQGFSFDTIVTKIGVSKPTLVKWEKSFRDTLDEANQAEIRALADSYKLGLVGRLEQLHVIQKKLEHEIGLRDFNTIQTKDLIQLSIKILELGETFLRGNRLPGPLDF